MASLVRTETVEITSNDMQIPAYLAEPSRALP